MREQTIFILRERLLILEGTQFAAKLIVDRLSGFKISGNQNMEKQYYEALGQLNFCQKHILEIKKCISWLNELESISPLTPIENGK